jgi:hypothetical protein
MGSGPLTGKLLRSLAILVMVVVLLTACGIEQSSTWGKVSPLP